MNINRIWAITLRHLYLWKHSLNRMADSFWFPALEVLVWGFVTVYLNKIQMREVNVATMLLGGAIFFRILHKAQFEMNVALNEERWSRNFVNLMTTPLTMAEFLAGTIILGLIKMVITLLTMTVLAAVIYQFDYGIFGFYYLPFILSLTLTGLAFGLVIDGLLLRFGNQVESLSWSLIWVLQPFSAVFYPLSSLPVWAQWIGKILPSTYIFEGMREIIIRGRLDMNLLTMSFGLNIVYLLLALVLFNRLFESSKEKGLLGKMD